MRTLSFSLSHTHTHTHTYTHTHTHTHTRTCTHTHMHTHTHAHTHAPSLSLSLYLSISHYTSSDNGVRSKRRDYRGFPSVHRHLPPVTPEACIRHVVFSQVMDLLWSEVATVLQPLVSAARDRALKGTVYMYTRAHILELYGVNVSEPG